MHGFDEIFYIPTFSCNCNCLHWGQSHGIFEPECDCGLIAQRIMESHCFSRGMLTIAGGEAFLKKGLPEMLASLCNLDKWDIQITTNGICVEAIKSFCNAVDSIQNKRVSFSISIDGMPETHNQIRQNVHAFERAAETLKYLQSIGVAAKVNTVVQQGNMDCLEKFAHFMSQNFNGVNISWMPEIFEANGRDKFPFTETETARMLPWIEDDVGRLYLETSGAAKIKNCHAGMRTILIAPSGKVYTCLTGAFHKKGINREDFYIGDLTKQSLDEIFMRCQDENAPHRKTVHECEGCLNPCEVGNEKMFWGVTIDQLRPEWNDSINVSNTEQAICVNELMDEDTLFQALVDAAAKTDHIEIENATRDYGIQLAVQCFVDRYKMFVKSVHTECSSGEGGNQWTTSIKLKNAFGGSDRSSYSVLADAYTESYYLTDCGGYSEFNRSHGIEMSPRLKDVYSLVNPAAGERILDVGCGRGELSFALAAAGAQVEGIDYSKDAIAVAQRTFGGKCETLRYTYADIFKMDNLDAFDKIVMADVVEHIEQEVLEKIFEKIAGSMNNSGSLVIHTAPNRDYYEITYPEIRAQAAGAGCWKPQNPRSYYEQLMHINEQTPVGLENALRKYFRYVKVWTGSIWDMNIAKAPDECRRDIEIFAIACQEESALEEKSRRYKARPELSEQKVLIEAPDLVELSGRSRETVPVTLVNMVSGTFVLSQKYPVNLAYHILDHEGNMILFDGERTLIYEAIEPGMRRDIQMRLSIPPDLDPSKEYICRITLVAEGCFWFDQEGKNKKDISIRLQ